MKESERHTKIGHASDDTFDRRYEVCIYNSTMNLQGLVLVTSIHRVPRLLVLPLVEWPSDR